MTPQSETTGDRGTTIVAAIVVAGMIVAILGEPVGRAFGLLRTFLQ